MTEVRFTAQELADLILAEDRRRRAALRAGDLVGAANHDAELQRLHALYEREHGRT